MSKSEITHTTILKVVHPEPPEVVDARNHIKRQKQLRLIFSLISLIIGLGGAAGLFIWFWPNRVMLRLATLILASFYIAWGTLTHTKAKNLAPRVFWEYFSISALGVLMLWLVI